MRVEILTHGNHRANTGIGRYVHNLAGHLGSSIEVKLSQLSYLPLATKVNYLKYLPVGIKGHVPNSIVHFPQIMGCAMMLYRPYHPSVATVHDLGFLELPEEWEMFDPIAHWLLRWSLAGLKRVDRIVADSEFTRQGIIKHLGVPENRVVTIHLCIDHNCYRPIPNAREILVGRYPPLAAAAPAAWLLYVGSELPRKNIATLLKAVARVREEIPDIRLIKVGAAGGHQFRSETLRAINHLGLENHVLFFEEVAEEDMPLFYNAADVFVTASKLEGFGFPVLEAMACGTPVVCSRAGSMPEIAEDVAFYSEPDDTMGMRDNIITALANHDHAPFSASSRIQRAACFHWNESASKLARLPGGGSTNHNGPREYR